MNFLSAPRLIAMLGALLLFSLLDWSDAALHGGEQPQGSITAPTGVASDTTGSNLRFSTDRQFHLSLRRGLEGDKCGQHNAPCVEGASCLTSPSGIDHCYCDTSQGWMNDPSINDVPGVVDNELWGYRSCTHRDECLDPALNMCADIPDSCVNLPPGPTPGFHQYKCICPKFYGSDDAFDVDPLLGPLHCVPLDLCQPASTSSSSPCLPGQNCIGFVGGFICVCPGVDDELLESGECRSSVVGSPSEQGSEVCGSSLKPCNRPGQFCEDGGTNNCLCKKGWIQPAGEGAGCQERQECDLKLDVDCDQTGRGTANAVSECIERTLEQDPRGYRCRCLVEKGFIAAPNIEDGTDCIVAPTASPSAAPSESVPPSGAATKAAAEVPGPLPFCRRVVCGFGQFCSAERRRCECLRGFVEVAPGPICEMEQCGAFTSIASSENALMDLGPPNICGFGCTETVSLLHNFPWVNGGSFSAITVTSNGNIWLGGGVSTCGCCSADPIELRGNLLPAPRIAVAQEDLDPNPAAPNFSIFASRQTDHTVISWEDLPHWSSGSPDNGLNFQAVLYDDGTIDFLYGSGNPPSGETIVAGLEDDDNSVAVPASGFPFGAGGQTSQGEWPTSQCRRFVPTPSGSTYCADATPGNNRCSCHEDFIPPGTDYSTLSCCSQCGSNASCQGNHQTGFLDCVCDVGFYGNGRACEPFIRPANDCGTFESLASLGSVISFSSTDEGITTVNLFHAFPWVNGVSFSAISVSTNGEMFLGANIPDPPGFGVNLVLPGGNTQPNAPRIAVAQEDLFLGSGAVYVAIGSDVTVVSWEGVRRHFVDSGRSMSFQAVLYDDGTIDLRYGSGNLPSDETIVAGLEDDANSVAVPACGIPFGVGGQTDPGAFPADLCRRFVPDNAGSYVQQSFI